MLQIRQTHVWVSAFPLPSVGQVRYSLQWYLCPITIAGSFEWVTSLSLFTFKHWRRKWQPTPVFLPGESQGRGSLVGCCLWGCIVRHNWSDLATAAAAYVNYFSAQKRWLLMSDSHVTCLWAGGLGERNRIQSLCLILPSLLSCLPPSLLLSWEKRGEEEGLSEDK